MKSFVKMTVATTKSRTLKLQSESCQKGCGDGIGEKKKNVHICLLLYIAYKDNFYLSYSLQFYFNF